MSSILIFKLLKQIKILHLFLLKHVEQMYLATKSAILRKIGLPQAAEVVSENIPW